MRHLFHHLPAIMFVLGLMAVAWAYGFAVRHYMVFPYQVIADGVKTGRALFESYERSDTGAFLRFSELPLAAIQTERIQALRAGAPAPLNLQDPVLFYGGRFAFMDECPSTGCLAVLYDRQGRVGHAYPLRPDAIASATRPADLPYEEARFVLARDMRPVGIERYADGDLLVAFQNWSTFPFGGGVARIAPDGGVRWFRRDYSHHWPKLMEDGSALVPGLRLRTETVSVRIHHDAPYTIELTCGDVKMLDDLIQIIDGDGQLVRQISVLDSLLASPFRAVIQHTIDDCDPIHLNYIDTVGGDLWDPSGTVRPGDFIVSMRNISTIGLIDRNSGRLKRMLRGSFLQQHSVSYWHDGRVLMFDNQGGGPEGGPSRLLAVDLLTGHEQTIFPTEETPEAFRGLFSYMAGKIDISPDLKRAIVTFSGEAEAIEVRLADGAVLTVFKSLHDVAGVATVPEKAKSNAAYARLYGVDYVGGHIATARAAIQP